MARCEYCKHYKKIYMPAVHRYTIQCEIETKKSVGCHDEFIFVDKNKVLEGEENNEMSIQN